MLISTVTLAVLVLAALLAATLLTTLAALTGLLLLLARLLTAALLAALATLLVLLLIVLIVLGHLSLHGMEVRDQQISTKKRSDNKRLPSPRELCWTGATSNGAAFEPVSPRQGVHNHGKDAP